MEKYLFKFFFAFSLGLTTVTFVEASFWTNWTEFPADPIYNPYPNPTNTVEDYYPFVAYNANTFDGNNVPGDPAYFYKMWHQGPNGIALSYSNNGVDWVLKGETNLVPPFATSRPTHPVVLYDVNGFGGTPYTYRIWYWQGFNTNCAGTTITHLMYSYSQDGFTWLAPQSSLQNPLAEICQGGVGLFALNGGPGFVIYNPNATSTPGQPFTFPYVLYFDATRTVGVNQERIGLATSPDGITWSLVGSTPVLEPGPSAWDSEYVFGARIIKAGDTYHMFYTGSNNVAAGTVPYAHGIGHASSPDGINWTKDADNPIFIYSNGVPWRNSRTWAPMVLFDEFCTNAGQCPTCVAKMWFSGGTGTSTGINQGIGFATLQCPQCLTTLTATPTVSLLGTSVTLTATMAGVAPFDLVWSDGFVQTGVTSPATRIVSPAMITTYSVTSTDANGCVSTSNDVTVGAGSILSAISEAIIMKYCMG